MVTIATDTKEALRKLAVEEREAWSDYLDATKGKDRDSYEEAEDRAWAALWKMLLRIRRRRRRLLG